MKYRYVLLIRFVRFACTRLNDNQTSRSPFVDPRSYGSSLDRKLLRHTVGIGTHFMLAKRLLTPVLLLSIDKVKSLTYKTPVTFLFTNGIFLPKL